MPVQWKRTFGVLAIGTVLCCGVPNMNAAQQDKPPASDNTKVNKRDRNASEPTADQGKNNVSDRDIMQKIRRSVMDDKSLSTYAHNVKIIAEHGKVTLKGPVRTAEEKQTIAQKATEVAGAGNVTDEMTIKASRTKSDKDK